MAIEAQRGPAAASPQARDSCASGYTGTATAFGPGRDGDERALWSGKELDIPVASPLTLVAVPTLVAIEAQERPKRRGDPAAGPWSLDPANDFVDVDGAARRSARAEIRQLAPDLTAPLAHQPSHYPEEGIWSSLLHQNSKRQFCTAPLVTMLREPPQESASRLDCCAERRLDLTTFRGSPLAL